ncbi:pimeloyl-ACP methyl ester carboxylesterase [Isoptericola sp. CG 20/1183]|uniref:Pimeloyl-ACP methyl ester carboxylesterase n=1 Tax=Isoptericola halotolerans TaxID=300560 RepID=A0ABX5EGY4_9MICO|nr:MULTISPECIES: alpha/beta fold hydrolase [Isoptericola]PRZ08749.1 pimeloyl-ACP methyl ester carboxylesterase [Isoptericola halotolerans]PRZ10804.1 pimeloyl-ACP methyl ester carboxylesterase [Isoptericola sp. CG 20/1183]
MTARYDVDLPDGRTLVVHDTGAHTDAHRDEPAVVWHHGSPQSGALLAPVVAAAAARGLRVLSPARSGYGGSTPAPGRSVADAAADVGHALDALGVPACHAVGASGGGPHALALAALRPDLVRGVVTLAGVAPYDGTDAWFAGMADDGGLRAALGGRAARERFGETAEFDETSFTEADYAMLAGSWAGLGDDAVRAGQEWPGGLVDDDVAFVRPWGAALADVTAPVLVVQGGADRVIPRHHGELLVTGLPAGELWLRPRDGHVSVLGALPVAYDWLRAV